MPPAEQKACGVAIGHDYPDPVVEHDWARKVTLARYKRAAGRGAEK
jgi:deoxyribodipyrimidine photolyase